MVENNAQLELLVQKQQTVNNKDEGEKEQPEGAKKKKKEKTSSAAAFPVVPLDGSVKLQLNLLPLLGSFRRTKKTLLIIVADRSSSMRGKPWAQVKLCFLVFFFL